MSKQNRPKRRSVGHNASRSPKGDEERSKYDRFIEGCRRVCRAIKEASEIPIALLIAFRRIYETALSCIHTAVEHTAGTLRLLTDWRVIIVIVALAALVYVGNNGLPSFRLGTVSVTSLLVAKLVGARSG